MIKKALAVALLLSTSSAVATYPTGSVGGSNAGVYWPNQFAHVVTEEWLRDYKYCSQFAYENAQGQYHSVYNDVDHYRYQDQNNAVEDGFQYLYLQCIHERGYPEIEY